MKSAFKSMIKLDFISERPSKSLMFKRCKKYLTKIALNKKYPKILDAACQTGWHIDFLIPNSYKYIGIDIDKQCVEACKLRYPKKSFFVADIKDLESFEEYDFDIILSTNTLEYLSNSDILTSLKAFISKLKTSGDLIFSINHSRYFDDHIFFNSINLFLLERFMNIKMLKYCYQYSTKFERKLSDSQGYYIAPNGFKRLYYLFGWIISYFNEKWQFGKNQGVLFICHNKL